MDMNIEKADKAKAFFKQGYTCSQSVVLAWSNELTLDIDTALRIAHPFGGGMGRLREVCGACSGAFMVLGLKYGSTDPKDAASKKKLYELVQAFAKRYKEENGRGSIVCRELLGLKGESTPTPSARTDEYYKKRPCVELIGLAAGLLDEFM